MESSNQKILFGSQSRTHMKGRKNQGSYIYSTKSSDSHQPNAEPSTIPCDNMICVLVQYFLKDFKIPIFDMYRVAHLRVSEPVSSTFPTRSIPPTMGGFRPGYLE